VNPELKARVEAARVEGDRADIAEREATFDRQRRFNDSLKVRCPHGSPYAWFCASCRDGADWWED
jgi:hypothetical protein